MIVEFFRLAPSRLLNSIISRNAIATKISAVVVFAFVENRSFLATVPAMLTFSVYWLRFHFSVSGAGAEGVDSNSFSDI